MFDGNETSALLFVEVKGECCDDDGGGISTSAASESALSVTEPDRGFLARGRGTTLGLGVASEMEGLVDPALLPGLAPPFAPFCRFGGLGTSEPPVSLLSSITTLPGPGPMFRRASRDADARTFLFPELGGDDARSVADSASVCAPGAFARGRGRGFAFGGGPAASAAVAAAL